MYDHFSVLSGNSVENETWVQSEPRSAYSHWYGIYIFTIVYVRIKDRAAVCVCEYWLLSGTSNLWAIRKILVRPQTKKTKTAKEGETRGKQAMELTKTEFKLLETGCERKAHIGRVQTDTNELKGWTQRGLQLEIVNMLWIQNSPWLRTLSSVLCLNWFNCLENLLALF